MYSENEFIKAISLSYQKYIEFGARSTQKLKPIHDFVARTLQSIWGNDYEIHYLGDEKYINLAYDTQQAHRPYSIGILLIDLDENNYKVKFLIPSSLFETDFAKLLENKLSMINLFSEIENYKKFLKTRK